MELQDAFALKVAITIVALSVIYFITKLSFRYFWKVGPDGNGIWAPMAAGIALGIVLAKLAVLWSI